MDAQGTGYRITQRQPLVNGRGLGHQSRKEGGGGEVVRMMEKVEQGREPRTGEPLELTGTWVDAEDGRGGATGQGKAVTGFHE